MTGRTWRLVLLISCAHALVHVFELSLASVEIEVASSYGVNTATTGLLATTWRFPFGVGALLAGWLVDRYGAPRLLVCYLIGCGLTSLIVAQSVPLEMLFGVMFVMGSTASIYHPAGLALLSFETTEENRAKALGVHGIFGSAGIGGAPFLAAIVLGMGGSWQLFYVVLTCVALALATFFFFWGRKQTFASAKTVKSDTAEQQAADGISYGMLAFVGLLQGFVYAAVLTFLRRYLQDVVDWTIPGIKSDAAATGAVLLVGCFAQYASGSFARPKRLEQQLCVVVCGSVPMLIWMSMAEGTMRLWAAAGFVLTHFMHQPLYNTLVAKYSSLKRRSLAYGFSFAMGLGFGSFGAAFAGFMATPASIYRVLAAVVTVAAIMATMLWRRTASLNQSSDS